MTDFWLAGPVTRCAYGWRMERRDGVTLGFTSHDRDVEIDGLLYRSSPGMVPTSITRRLGLDVDGLDVQGALSSDTVRSDDLSAGRWDGARLSIFLFDWGNPALGQRVLAVGELGAMSHQGDAFEAEFKAAAVALDRPVAPHTAPGCRAEFCDRDCGLSAARFSTESQVTFVTGDQVHLSQPLPGPANAYAYGRLRWLEGRNCGLVSDIVSGEGSAVLLAEGPAFPVAAGTRVALSEGCDKTLATCAARFANAVNFRGEPFLPGNDILTRYPGA